MQKAKTIVTNLHRQNEFQAHDENDEVFREMCLRVLPTDQYEWIESSNLSILSSLIKHTLTDIGYSIQYKVWAPFHRHFMQTEHWSVR